MATPVIIDCNSGTIEDKPVIIDCNNGKILNEDDNEICDNDDPQVILPANNNNEMAHDSDSVEERPGCDKITEKNSKTKLDDNTQATKQAEYDQKMFQLFQVWLAEYNQKENEADTEPSDTSLQSQDHVQTAEKATARPQARKTEKSKTVSKNNSADIASTSDSSSDSLSDSDDDGLSDVWNKWKKFEIGDKFIPRYVDKPPLTFRKWLRRKNAQKRAQQEKGKISAKAFRDQFDRSRKLRRQVEAIKRTERALYVDYYGYRV